MPISCCPLRNPLYGLQLDLRVADPLPTSERSPEFIKLYRRLTGDQKALFRAAVAKFIADLRRGKGFRKGLRVKRIKGAPGMFELTWLDGRAVFSYGNPVNEGEPHIVWHAVGTHDVLP